MKNYLYGIFAIAFLAFTACTNEELPTPGTGQDTPVEHKSGEILVKFSPYVSKILDKTTAASAITRVPNTFVRIASQGFSSIKGTCL